MTDSLDPRLQGKLKHGSECESELTSHGYTPCRCDERSVQVDALGAVTPDPLVELLAEARAVIKRATYPPETSPHWSDWDALTNALNALEVALRDSREENAALRDNNAWLKASWDEARKQLAGSREGAASVSPNLEPLNEMIAYWLDQCRDEYGKTCNQRNEYLCRQCLTAGYLEILKERLSIPQDAAPRVSPQEKNKEKT